MWDPSLDELHKVDGKKTRQEFLELARRGLLSEAGKLLRVRLGRFLDRELEEVLEHLWLTSAGNRRLVTKALLATSMSGASESAPPRLEPEQLDALYSRLQQGLHEA